MIRKRLAAWCLGLAILLGVGLAGAATQTAASAPTLQAAPVRAAWACSYCLVIYHADGSRAYNLHVAKDTPYTCADSRTVKDWLPRGWSTRSHPEFLWADAACIEIPDGWDAIVYDSQARTTTCVLPPGWRRLAQPPYVTQSYYKYVTLIPHSDTRC